MYFHNLETTYSRQVSSLYWQKLYTEKNSIQFIPQVKMQFTLFKNLTKNTKLKDKYEYHQNVALI